MSDTQPDALKGHLDLLVEKGLLVRTPEEGSSNPDYTPTPDGYLALSLLVVIATDEAKKANVDVYKSETLMLFAGMASGYMEVAL